uniref:Uncharacterized protein n=1 Tax=Euplotes harpa TaxID=151035 RepID=A0A7S3NEV5_9SPIT|mmetsp:Transcript_4724/g.5629  ORF Transcript_4724/g.5629 Transcript_4724/m.5629 type:complete len:163 (+) Transcript_4724:12-500(+)
MNPRTPMRKVLKCRKESDLKLPVIGHNSQLKLAHGKFGSFKGSPKRRRLVDPSDAETRRKVPKPRLAVSQSSNEIIKYNFLRRLVKSAEEDVKPSTYKHTEKYTETNILKLRFYGLSEKYNRERLAGQMSMSKALPRTGMLSQIKHGKRFGIVQNVCFANLL